MKTLIYVLLAVVSVVWIAAVYFVAIDTWPAFSLDLSPVDDGTRSAYDAAVTGHIVRYALAAVFPPLIAFGVMRALLGLTGRRAG